MKKLLISFFLCALSLSAHSAPKHVLLLVSGAGYTGAMRDLVDGFIFRSKELATELGQEEITFFVEPLGGYLKNPEGLDDYAKALSQKYRSIPLETVLAQGLPSSNFIQRYPGLFGDANIEVFSAGKKRNLPNVTEHELPGGGEISYISDLMPKLETLAVVGASDQSGFRAPVVKNWQAQFSEKFDLRSFDADKLTLPELERALSKLSDNSAILLEPAVFTGSDDQPVLPAAVLKLIASKIERPIFVHVDTMLDSGLVVAGYAFSLELLGARMAERAYGLEVTAASSGYYNYIADYEQLIQFGLDPNRLPSETVLLNGPAPSFWRTHTYEITLFITAFFLVALYSLYLRRTVGRMATAALEQAQYEGRLRLERDKALTQLQLEEHRRNAVSQTADIGFLQYDYANSRCYGDGTELARHGLTEDAQYWDVAADIELFPSKSREILETEIRTLAHQPAGTVASFTIEMYVQPSNELRTFRISGLNIENDGNLLFFGASVDVTDEVNAKSRAETAALELKAQQDRQAQMYAVIGHELRTPAASLKMMLEDLEEGEALDTDLASSNIEQLLSVIDTLRAVAQPERLARTAFSAVQIDELLQQQVANFTPFAERNNIKLVTDLTDLRFEPVYLQKSLLRQVLANLIKNAIVHSQSNLVCVRAKAKSVNERREYLTLIVEDNGCGIDPNVVDRLFEAYVRGSTEAEGTGLGLHVCREIIKSMGGELRFEPNPSGGSRFIIGLEVTLAKHVEIPDDTAERKDVLSGARILLAEDNKTIQMLTQKILTKQGATVSVFNNGAEALSCFEAGDFDLVLSDIFMPEMDGYKFVAALRQKGFSGKVIGLTAATIGEETDRMLSAGADVVLSKPINLNELKAILID